jgi:hypothetical protein
MNTIEFVRFLAFLLIAGALLRTVELQWPDTAIGKALAVLY